MYFFNKIIYLCSPKTLLTSKTIIMTYEIIVVVSPTVKYGFDCSPETYYDFLKFAHHFDYHCFRIFIVFDCHAIHVPESIYKLFLDYLRLRTSVRYEQKFVLYEHY